MSEEQLPIASQPETPSLNEIQPASEVLSPRRWRAALHIGKRAVQGAIVAMEIGPVNEIIRYGALGAALVVSDGNPLIGAAVMGGTTFTVEGSAALAVSGMLASENGEKTIRWVEGRLSKTLHIPQQKLEEWKMGPLPEAGIGLVVGSVAVLAEKQREDKERSARQNRKYGLFTAGWLSAVCAAQGAIVAYSKEAGTDYSAYLNARTIGSAALALGTVVGASRWVMHREKQQIENQELMAVQELRHFSRKTGEEYLFTEDPALIEKGNEIEAKAWERHDFGDSSVNRKYDDQSRVIIARKKNGDVVGVSRVFRHGKYPLPSIVEMTYDDETKKAELEALAEAGLLEEFGITARDEDRTTKKETALNMFRLAYRDAKRRGVKNWLVIMEPSRVKLMNRFYRFTFRQMGPTVRYQGGDCAAHLLSFDEVEPRMRHSWSRRARWFEGKPL